MQYTETHSTKLNATGVNVDTEPAIQAQDIYNAIQSPNLHLPE